MLKQKMKLSRGQALVEFALMLTVLLMLIFLIIESSRIFWGWITVQNAAREGARYAITGQFMGPDCAVDNLPKFNHICEEIDRETLRAAGIVSVTHRGLSGLPLNEESVTYEDEYYYLIEVLGVPPGGGDFLPDYGGGPGQAVVVRATYRVPMITPFFSTIIPSIRVVGQVTENNEQFGQLGGSQAVGLPNDPPPVPTAGPSPTPTFTPTPDPDPPPPPTLTPTSSPTPTPICETRFVQNPLAGQVFALVTGDVGQTVTLINWTTGGQTLATAVLQAQPGHVCGGLTNFGNNLAPLVAGHILIVTSENGSGDTARVLGGSPTPTHTATFTPAPPVPPTSTPTPTLTPTPTGPFIVLLPTCGPGPSVQFNFFGANWPHNRSISIYWNTNQLVQTIPQNQHDGSFSGTIVRNNVATGTYQVVAAADGPNNETASAIFSVPCPGIPVEPTTTATATGTPAPADLVIVGPPELISTPPIVAYQPVQYRLVISNTGDIDINQQFFIDLYLDPGQVLTRHIPLIYSSGYQGVSGLPGQASRVLSITAPFGFHNEPEDHVIYGMVDSLQQINETNEENNISTPAFTSDVTPAATPTPTAAPDEGANFIGGVVRSRVGGNWVPQFRTQVRLIDADTGQVARIIQTDSNGFYQFNDIPDGLYNVSACIAIDNKEYTGIRTGLEIPPSNGFVDIFMLEGPCS